MEAGRGSGSLWTVKEDQTAQNMRRLGAGVREIADFLRRTPRSVETRLARLRPGSLRHSYYGVRKNDGGRNLDKKIEISSSAMAERDLRAGIEPRDLTALLQGDPLPGYSALEAHRIHRGSAKNVSAVTRRSMLNVMP